MTVQWITSVCQQLNLRKLMSVNGTHPCDSFTEKQKCEIQVVLRLIFKCNKKNGFHETIYYTSCTCDS